MSHQKLQEAIETAGVCCKAKLLEQYPNAKALEKVVDVHVRTVEKWRRRAREEQWICRCINTVRVRPE